jgi:peptidyl serine alpha-galactosyltransferase
MKGFHTRRDSLQTTGLKRIKKKKVSIAYLTFTFLSFVLAFLTLFPILFEHLSRKQQYENSDQMAGIDRTQREDNHYPSIHVQGEPRYFVVFSTGCTEFQDWQAISFFHFAKNIKQKGNVTRILSGCSDTQSLDQEKAFQELIAPLSPSFSLHITPDYGVRDNQKYWNKPKGLLDWFEKGLGFPRRAADYENDIIIILDPDMMILRPMTHHFDDYASDWLTDVVTSKVVPGIPIAQAYGFGAGWLSSMKGKLEYVVGKGSPALNVTTDEAGLYYPAGPPYLATSGDMYKIAVLWVEFLPRVHDIFPQFMAEMYAYCIAAAHLKLKHQLAKGFMVSDVSAAHREGYHFLNNVTRKDACLADIPMTNLPYVMHFCQRYAVGRWFFSKYKLREDFFKCTSPLMKEPPRNVGEIYDWHIFPNGVEFKDYHDESRHHFIVKHTWMLCTVLFSLNQVAIDIKKKHCEDKANFDKSWHFHEKKLFDATLHDPSNPFLIQDEFMRNKKLFLGV